MKITVTKEELLALCAKCAEKDLQGICNDYCVFGEVCGRVYIDFWRDNTEVSK